MSNILFACCCHVANKAPEKPAEVKIKPIVWYWNKLFYRRMCALPCQTALFHIILSVPLWKTSCLLTQKKHKSPRSHTKKAYFPRSHFMNHPKKKKIAADTRCYRAGRIFLLQLQPPYTGKLLLFTSVRVCMSISWLNSRAYTRNICKHKLFYVNVANIFASISTQLQKSDLQSFCVEMASRMDCTCSTDIIWLIAQCPQGQG